MNNTPSEIFESLFDLINSSPEKIDDWTEEQWTIFIKQLHMKGKETYDKMHELSEEFTSLRDKNLELEDMILLLHENLDKQKENMTNADITNSRKICSKIYSDFWNELDSVSQEFFVTAHYLYERSKSQNADFSPVIIEFCRIFENELLVKVFKGFIQTLATSSRLLSYQNSIFNKIYTAIDSQNNNGFFFLSSMDMIKLLSHMNRTFNNNTYEKELQNYICRKGFDIVKISNRNHFIKPAKDYVNDYRNEAAHPNFLHEDTAADCKEMTRILIEQFLNAQN